MVLKGTLERVVLEQKREAKLADMGISREMANKVDLKIPHVIILSGIRMW